MRQFRFKSQFLPALFIPLLVGSGVMEFSLRKDVPVQSGSPVMKINLSATIARSGGNVAVEKAGPVSPGEVISYTIASKNEGSGPALDYKAIGPIPAKTIYVDGSAKAEGASAVYSIDGGKAYSSKPMIDQKQPDGTVKKVAAPVSMYTHVRFEWTSPVLADSHSIASYQVRVK